MLSDSHILHVIKSMSPFGHQLNGIVNSGASLPTERFCHDTHLSDAMLRTFFRPAVRKTTAVTGREAFGSCYDICQTKKTKAMKRGMSRPCKDTASILYEKLSKRKDTGVGQGSGGGSWPWLRGYWELPMSCVTLTVG